MFSRKNKVKGKIDSKVDQKPKKEITNKKISNDIPSIIVADLNIEGDLVSHGSVEVGGKVEAHVRCNNVVVRKEARIHGNIHADEVSVFGYVDGKIHAKNVNVKDTGFVEGIIEYDKLILTEF